VVVNQRSPTDDNWTPPPPYPSRVVIASLTAPQPLGPLLGAVSFSSGLRVQQRRLVPSPTSMTKLGGHTRLIRMLRVPEPHEMP